MTADVERLAAIASWADALPVAVWVGEAKTGTCVYVNREFESVLGIKPPEDAARQNYVGPYRLRLPSGEPYPEDRMPFERVMRSKKTEVIDDIVIHRHDGSRGYLRVFASPMLDDAGEIAFIVEAFTDITKEVETERRRADGERQLQAMQRLESVGSLAGGVAHDFNNLLAVVKLVAGQLRVGETDNARLELIRCLDEVADSAAKLTRALLGFARRGKYLARHMSVHEVTSSVVELARRTFGRRFDIHDELRAYPDVIVGDAVQVEQIVMNLVLNARDAIGGEGRITVRTRRAKVAQGEHAILSAGDYVIIEVEDTGGGIEPAVRDRIFEPYVTTKSTGSQKGTGLGLATVYGIAFAHGGVAEIGHTSPGGTVMRVFLPASSAVAADGAVLSRAGTGGARGRVLVVDDEPLVLRMMAESIGALGYDVVTAPSGEAAVSELHKSKGQIAGVVLDMIMPGMSGKETYLALRALEPNIRVVLTTGYALNHEAQLILDLGVKGFVPKPFTTAELADVLARVLAE